MKLTSNPQDFITSSLQLLEARPSTTKVTTTYNAGEPGKGKLTLKTYDPVSGAVIKFKTSKIADVGRIIAGLHRLAREQAGVPQQPVAEDTMMPDASPSGTPGTSTPATTTAQPAPSELPKGGKSKKNKKKGK